MSELKRRKKTRSKNLLFNPYANGISSYDLAFLSSRRVFKNKTIDFHNEDQKDYFAA